MQKKHRKCDTKWWIDVWRSPAPKCGQEYMVYVARGWVRVNDDESIMMAAQSCRLRAHWQRFPELVEARVSSRRMPILWLR
jgi:hypothetical protein